MTRGGIGSNQYATRSGGVTPPRTDPVISEIAAAFAGDIGFYDWHATPEEIEGWYNARISPWEAAVWTAHRPDVTPTQAQQIAAVVPDPSERMDWLRSPVPTADIAAWAASNIDVHGVELWVGHYAPDDARYWILGGFASAGEVEWWQNATGNEDPTGSMETAWASATNGTGPWNDPLPARRHGMWSRDRYDEWNTTCGDINPDRGRWVSPDMAGRADAAGMTPNQLVRTIALLANDEYVSAAGLNPDHSASTDMAIWWHRNMPPVPDDLDDRTTRRRVLTEAREFRQRWRDTPWDPSDWIVAGFDDPDVVRAWGPVAFDTNPSDATDVLLMWRAAGHDIDTTRRWMTAIADAESTPYPRPDPLTELSPIGLMIAARGGSPDDLRRLVADSPGR